MPAIRNVRMSWSLLTRHAAAAIHNLVPLVRLGQVFEILRKVKRYPMHSSDVPFGLCDVHGPGSIDLGLCDRRSGLAVDGS